MIVEGRDRSLGLFLGFGEVHILFLLCFCWFGLMNGMFMLVDCEASIGVCSYRGSVLID